MIVRWQRTVLAALVAALSMGLPAFGVGSLVARTPDGAVDLPVMQLEVRFWVTGVMLHGEVVEAFTNDTGRVIDATYVLPLPEHAAVNDMELSIGARRIAAVVREKEQAAAEYEAARTEGRKAALVAQNRPNLFTTAVANVNPGETVRVSIHFLHEVVEVDGAFEFAFPMTWTPRYCPLQSSQESAPASFAAAEAAAPRAFVRAEIDLGVPIESVESPSHQLAVRAEGTTTVVEPADNPIACDRDLVLRWRPQSGGEPGAALFVEEREDGQYALLTLYPPHVPADGDDALPTDTVFVVDVSGSMAGQPIDQARRALLAALDRLHPLDSFNLVKFDDQYDDFRDTQQPAIGAALEEGRAFVRGLEADGGTEILPALLHAIELAQRADSTRPRRIVLVTDGAVENEDEVFAAVAARLGDVRLHLIGIGSAPNRHLMKKLALHGRGACEFIASSEEVEVRVDALLARLERPVLTGVTLDWNGAPPLDVFPERIPDLYAGSPLVVSLRLGHSHPGTTAVLSGGTARGRYRTELVVGSSAPAGSGIATRWARAKVGALLDRLLENADPGAVRADVLAVALPFRLVTPYTSLVAVEATPTAEGPATPIAVANALPHGSRLFDGALPMGGTDGPLHVALGAALIALAAGLALAATRIGR